MNWRKRIFAMLVLMCIFPGLSRSEDPELGLPKLGRDNVTTDGTTRPETGDELDDLLEEVLPDFPPSDTLISEEPTDLSEEPTDLSEEPTEEREGFEAEQEERPTAEGEEEILNDRIGQSVGAPEEESEFVDIYVPPIQRTAIHQAFGTGEAILGNLGGLQGAVRSPFLAPSIPSSLPLRIGSIFFDGRVSAGVLARPSNRSANRGEWISGLFAGSVEASYSHGLSSAGLSYGFGLAYPELGGVRRSNATSENSVSFDQQLSFGASFVFPEMKRVQFGFGLSFTGLSGIDRDVGTETGRNIATISLSASYRYSEKTSFDYSISFPIRDFSSGVSSNGITNTLSINNQISEKTNVGLGYSTGFLNVSSGENQIVHQGLIYANSSPTAFLSFNSTLGLEVRDAESSSTVSPIFGLGSRWNSTRGTTVALAVESRVFNAASASDTNYVSTSVTLGMSQTLWYDIVGSLSFGYEHAEYESVGRGGRGGRIDNLYSVALRFGIPITTRWSCFLGGQWGTNRSNVEPFDYSQVNFQISYAF